jgi:hypothetical protein
MAPLLVDIDPAHAPFRPPIAHPAVDLQFHEQSRDTDADQVQEPLLFLALPTLDQPEQLQHQSNHLTRALLLCAMHVHHRQHHMQDRLQK